MAKIGEGHFAAWLRQGLREIRGALYPDSNVAQPAEYGLYGTRTPGEVAESRRGDGRELEEEPRGSVLGDRLKEAEERSGRDDRDQDRGLDR